jgi:hypothetical protein
VKYRSNLLHEYKSIEDISETLNKHPSDILLGAKLAGIPVYFVNQSQKVLVYIPMEYNYKKAISLKGFKALFRIGSTVKKIEKGQLLKIKITQHLDYLLKGILNEKELFFIWSDGKYFLEGRAGVFQPRLGWWSSNFVFNTFQNVSLNHAYIKVEDFEKLGESLKKLTNSNYEEKESKQGKQKQRELIFLEWLQGQNEFDVPNMKKDDVWAELQKLDHVLFSVESKNFFRDQKIITFKSGRKSISEH